MNFRVNKDQAVAVAMDQYWLEIDSNTPRGVKVMVYSENSGVATCGTIDTNELFFTHWYPLPRFRRPSNDAFR